MTTPKPLPDIHLLCMIPSGTTAFQAAIQKHFPTLPTLTSITHHNLSLKQLPRSLSFSAVVSPANSFARLDGAFDDAIAREYGPYGDYNWITHVAQRSLYQQARGFAVPGSCTIIPIPGPESGVRHDKRKLDWPDLPGTAGLDMGNSPWDSRYLLLCPTMKFPHQVTWDREVIYECIWSLLNAIHLHNRAVQEGRKGEGASEITSILMTPLATGVGRVSETRWAEQCVLAMRQWVEAGREPEKYERLEWESVYEICEPVEGTFSADI